MTTDRRVWGSACLLPSLPLSGKQVWRILGPSSQVWRPPSHSGAKFKGRRGLPHPPPFHPYSAPPPHPSRSLSTCRKWATCFQKVIPGPVWATKLIRIYHPVKGKERKSPVFRGLSRCGGQKRFPLSLLGKPLQMRHWHFSVAVSHWLLVSSCYKARCINSNRRKP